MSDPAAPRNPFPGPQPYRAADRATFFGREDMVRRLANRVLAHPVTTLFGPSGAGKTSLMQAGVIPWLEEAHAFRVVRVDRWPPGEAPLGWLVSALFEALALGAPPADPGVGEALDEAMCLAERRSERPMLIYLDQLEQILLPGRSAAEAAAFVEGVDRLAGMPIRGLQIVLALREDYLGRFRDRAQGRRDLLDRGFRVASLSVCEMAGAVCRAAAGGVPPQIWPEGPMHDLLLEVRTPGEPPSECAEVQAAFGQIVCRALWEARASGEEAAREIQAADAEAIVHRHFEETLEALGARKEGARALLEEHLIDAEGHRALLTEKEAHAALPGGAAAEILAHLEKAAVLHAEEHQGSRYFELGHDWLAARVYARRQEREREEAERALREGEDRAREDAERRRSEEAARKLARTRRDLLAVVVFGAIASLVGMMFLVVWALAERDHAKGAERTANMEAHRAWDAALLGGARELLAQGRPAAATRLLLGVSALGHRRAWVQLASECLEAGPSAATLRGHTARVATARFSPDGERIVTASDDATARVFRADGAGDPVVLRGHDGTVVTAAFSPDGSRVLTASTDLTARVWRADGSGTVTVFRDHTGEIVSAAFSPEGSLVLTASLDGTARIWSADGSGAPVVLKHDAPVRAAAWSPDGARIVTASDDGIARVWSADGAGAPRLLKGHGGAIHAAAWSPDGARVVTASEDTTARVWDLDAGTSTVFGSVRVWHPPESVVSAMFSADGSRILTRTRSGLALQWAASAPGVPADVGRLVEAAAFGRSRDLLVTTSSGRIDVLDFAERDVLGQARKRTFHADGGRLDFVDFSPDGRRIVVACSDGAARVFRMAAPPALAEIPETLDALRAATTDCLPPEVREKHLEEAGWFARERYEECERSYGRTPFYPDAGAP